MGDVPKCFEIDMSGVSSSDDMYVYLLPFSVRKTLAAILDTDNTWELLGLIIHTYLYSEKNSINPRIGRKVVAVKNETSYLSLFVSKHDLLPAFVMPDIGNADIRACRDAGSFESPTENLLAIWGSKGNKVTQLYNCLGRAKLVRAMKAMRHLGMFFLGTFVFC